MGGPDGSSSPVLECRHVGVQFGGLTALSGVSVDFLADDIAGIVGPNGAGKSTLFNVIVGLQRTVAGSVHLDAVDFSHMAPDDRARFGVVKTFQDARPFEGQGMTVLDNVAVGAYAQYRSGSVAASFRSRKFRSENRRILAACNEYLEQVGIPDLGEARPGSLAYGERRLVEIARAIASRPRFLLLDEPTAGLTAPETEKLAEALLRIHGEGIGLVVIDHDLPFIFDIAEQVTVLVAGRVLMTGTANAVRENPDVAEAYFGSIGDD